MANFVLNDADAAFGPNSALSSPDARDFDILIAALNGTGVVSGCAVTAQGSPNMTVAVAAGVVQSGQKISTITAATATIGANATGNPRFDLIVVDASTPLGLVSVVAGTAAPVPVFPTYTAGRVVLAAVYVEPSDTTIASNQILDKRVAPPQYINGLTEMLVDGLQEYRRINGLTLRHWLKALANRNYVPANIWVVGDSVAECYGVTSDDQKFVWQMREALQNMYRPGGVGFIPARHGVTPWLYTSNPDGKNTWALTSLVDNVFYGWGLGDRAAFLGTTAASTATITVDCDQFYLMFTMGIGLGTATIDIDAGTAFAQTFTFATSSNPAMSGQIYESPLLPLGTHTVKVTSTTASNFVVLDGIMPFFTDKLNGIHLWDSAHSGYLAANFDYTLTDARGAGSGGFWAEAAVQPVSASVLTDGSTATTATFAASASEQTFIVPTGVTSLTVDCQGAKGGQGGGGSGPGGNGGRVQTTLAVTPGETLKIGAATLGGNNSGTGGGGAGFYAAGGGGGAGLTFGGGGGGGQSYIKQGGTADSNRVVVAGGGAGGANNSSSGQGGGQTLSTQGTGQVTATNGTGGGGIANGGGGGGGGWVGGAGGGTNTGGAGGSNMTNTGVCSATTSTASFNTGAGTVILTWTGASTLLNSATAAFTANDVGEYVFPSGSVAGIGFGNQIVAVNSTTQAVMSKSMTSGVSSLAFKIGRSQVADWSITNTSTTATSATAAFNKWDEGKLLIGAAGIPAGTYIKRVNSATSIEMSKAATATASSQTVRIQNRVTYPVQPDLLIIQFGLNDMKYAVTSAAYKQNIRNIVLHATQRGGATYAPSVLLLGLWAPGLTYNWLDSTAVTSNGSAVMTGTTGDYAADLVGLSVTGTNIPGSTTVLSVQDPFHLTLSANATGNVAGTANFVNRVTTEAMWLRYRQAMMELADENSWAFCDLYSLLGYINSTDPQNITFDLIHPNNNGSRLIGDEMNRILGGTPKLGAVPAGVFDNVGDSVWGTGVDTYTKIGAGVDGTMPTYAAGAKSGVVPKMPGSSSLIGQILPVIGGTTALATGLPAPTLTATVTNADDNEASWLNFATSTTQFNASGIVSAAFTVTRSGRLPEFDAYIKTDPAAITSIAYAIGLSSASLDVASAVAPAAAVVGAYFLYNTTVHGTATWRTCTSDGTTIKTYDTFKTIAVNTTYRQRIAIRGVRGTSIAAVDFYINDVIASTHIVNLPTFSTALGFSARVETLTTAARNLKVARLSLSGP